MTNIEPTDEIAFRRTAKGEDLLPLVKMLQHRHRLTDRRAIARLDEKINEANRRFTKKWGQDGLKLIVKAFGGPTIEEELRQEKRRSRQLRVALVETRREMKRIRAEIQAIRKEAEERGRRPKGAPVGKAAK